jgi:ABC-type transport system involved in multi-copper enzyme maturation permease subunit
MTAKATLTRSGWFATALEAARQTLLLLRHRRVGWLLLLAMVVGGGLAFVLAGRVHDRVSGRLLYCLLSWWGGGTVIVPWTTVYLGVQAIHGEIEDRTSQYLFLRPIDRVPLLLGKWLAIVVAGCAIAWTGSVILFLAIAAHGEIWRDGIEPGLCWTFCVVFTLGSAAYAAVAMFFGATFRRPLAWAAFFVVGVQMLAANLPVSAGLRQLTITDPLRRMVLERVVLDESNPDRRLAGAIWPAERSFEADQIGSPVTNLLVFTVVCLLLAAWRYATTEYESRSRD